VWWDPGDAAHAAAELRQVLDLWGTGVEVSDARRGLVEWPRPRPEDWRALVRALVPARAAWVRGGLAPHPLLAKWVARAGAALKLPAWEAGEGLRVMVCEEPRAEAAWASLPLQAVPCTAVERQRWRRAGFRRAGEVPGLTARLLRLPPGGPVLSVHPLMVERRFPEPLYSGPAVVLEEMAADLAARMQAAGLVSDGLKLAWEPERGPRLIRERTWPYAAGSVETVVLRALGLAQPWPEGAPVALQLATGVLTPARPEQLNWWREAAPSTDLRGTWGAPAPSRREQRLQYWDPWRCAGGRGRRSGS
jgi:hypothetical protein